MEYKKDMADAKLRLCTPEDEALWIRLNREFMAFEIQDSEFWNDTEKASDESFSATYREALAHPELSTLMMIELEGTVIGFANLMTIFSIWANGRALILDDLYIVPAYQGHGAGRNAVEAIITYAQRENYRRLQFQSEKANTGALAFYQRLGFEPSDMYFYVRYFD